MSFQDHSYALFTLKHKKQKGVKGSRIPIRTLAAGLTDVALNAVSPVSGIVRGGRGVRGARTSSQDVSIHTHHGTGIAAMEGGFVMC